MNSRWRIAVVITRTPVRGLRLASAEARGLPPRDAVLMAAQFLQLGAEVRVLDQDTERLSDRIVRREVRLWRADLVLLWSGGSAVADNPVPDAGPLRSLLSSWQGAGPVVAAGPLASRYGAELLATFPRLAGALTAANHPALVGAWRPDQVPGLLHRPDGRRDAPVVATPALPADAPPVFPHVLPAWHALPLDALDARTPDGARRADVLCGQGGLAGGLEQVRHAVHRGGARFIVFTDRDLGADIRLVRGLSRGMYGVAPGIPWSCRVRADRVDPMLALTLANGGCREMLVCPPVEPSAPGLAPMDDPVRPRLESAVDAARATGMGVAVLHVIGRPGHTRDSLAAWQRWFGDRRMVVHAHVRVLHAGDGGPGQPALREAHARAGCWQNELTPRDVERAVREVSDRSRLAAGVAGA